MDCPVITSKATAAVMPKCHGSEGVHNQVYPQNLNGDGKQQLCAYESSYEAPVTKADTLTTSLEEDKSLNVLV